MNSIRGFVPAVMGVALFVACNALLDNDPRYLAGPGGEAGEGGAGRGGQHQGVIGGNAEGGTLGGADSPGGGEAGTTGATAGEGGAPTCGSCVLAQATSECRKGACVISACKTGFVDANSNADDGCEAGDVASNALTLWFMADRGLTLSGEQVSAWVDQSAAHVTASAMSAAAMPKRVKQATGPQMVEFDGADDGLKLPDGFSTFNGTTFFAVAEAYPASGCAGILSLSNGDDNSDIEYGRHTSNLLYYEVLGDFVEGATDAFVANQRLLVSITQNSTGAVELRINGVLNASPKTIPVPPVVVRTQNYLGRDTYTACPQAYKGLLGELILYTRKLSDDEFSRTQAYLAAKWSIPAATP
jgi:hypothetical protein